MVVEVFSLAVGKIASHIGSLLRRHIFVRTIHLNKNMRQFGVVREIFKNPFFNTILFSNFITNFN